jgi:hypothetical protein
LIRPGLDTGAACVEGEVEAFKARFATEGNHPVREETVVAGSARLHADEENAPSTVVVTLAGVVSTP